MSIILMSEVGGKLSILLMKIVVITSIVVRFTLKAASKKKGLKKVVAKVMAVNRRVGKYVVIGCHYVKEYDSKKLNWYYFYVPC